MDLQRIELALTPRAATREVCISPGLMTGFLFDTPVELELQDEVRFAEVLRSRNGIGFVPPRDIAPGERLRLTARIGAGATQDVVTFMLVAHSGKATHQVEVYRDQRSRESFQHEVAQQWAKIQQLRQKLDQTQAQVDASGELLEQVSRKLVSGVGIKTREFNMAPSIVTKEPITLLLGITYRAKESIAVEMWMKNLSSEPWMVADASMVDETGQKKKGVRFWQKMPIQPNRDGSVVMEADAAYWEMQGEWVMSVRDVELRGIVVAAVAFP